MKNLLTIAAALSATLNLATAQSIEITPTYAHQWGGKLEGISGDLSIGKGDAYGVDVNIKPESLPLGITFIWSRLDSYVEFEEFSGTTERLFDMATEYFLLGSTREHAVSDAFVPFFTGALGVANFTPDNANLSSELKMAGSIGGGLKIYPSERIGLRVHVRMLIPFQWGSAGIFCGSGGCSTSVGASSSIIQGDVGGGLIFRIQ